MRIGLDIGSRTVKRVTVLDGVMRDYRVVANSHDPLSVCDELLSDKNGAEVIATGYGRRLFAERRGAKTLTEIKAVALGAKHLLPNVRTLLDIGGQDTKVIALDASGDVTKFEMNDRCAAGTGRFLEVMATALAYPLDEFVAASLAASSAQTVNAMCAVFAESEVISATARGVDRAELARGIHLATVRRAVSMLRRIPLHDDIAFCGGAALNDALYRLLQEALKRPLQRPQNPQIVAALGAALSE
jgi:predicted CoA-substrate-specific enzyme activase